MSSPNPTTDARPLSLREAVIARSTLSSSGNHSVEHDRQKALTATIRDRLGYHGASRDHFDPTSAARLIQNTSETWSVISADLQRGCFLTVYNLLGNGNSYVTVGAKPCIKAASAIGLLKDLTRRGWVFNSCRSDCLASYQEGFKDLAHRALVAAYADLFNQKEAVSVSAERLAAFKTDLEALREVVDQQFYGNAIRALEHQASQF